MTNAHSLGGDLSAPKAIAPFVNKCPRLLPGETETEYWALFDVLMEDMVPATNTEWLVLADVVGLFWEIRRQIRGRMNLSSRLPIRRRPRRPC